MRNINDELIKIKSQIRRKKKWQTQIMDYENERMEINENISMLSKQLKMEEKDVEKLEGRSISNLIQTILGNKEEKLEKEKQEVVSVQIKLNEARKHKRQIEKNIKELQYKVEKMGDVEKQYKSLFMQKESYIKQSESSTVLFELSEQEGDLRDYIEELDEAIVTGRKAKEDLVSAKNSLDSAATWGVFDIFGGGAVSSLIKHNNIDEAAEEIHKAQTSLRYFQKELLDVKEELTITIDISGMLKFADFFLDNFFTDYMVQDKIHDAIGQVDNRIIEVTNIISTLEEQIKEKEEKRDQVIQERKQFIESY